jgi:hypothetical protein
VWSGKGGVVCHRGVDLSTRFQFVRNGLSQV